MQVISSFRNPEFSDLFGQRLELEFQKLYYLPVRQMIRFILEEYCPILSRKGEQEVISHSQEDKSLSKKSDVKMVMMP